MPVEPKLAFLQALARGGKMERRVGLSKTILVDRVRWWIFIVFVSEIYSLNLAANLSPTSLRFASLLTGFRRLESEPVVAIRRQDR